VLNVLAPSCYSGPDRGQRARSASIALALAGAVSACSGLRLSKDAPRQPTLRVADAALASGAPDLALRVADLIITKQPGNAPALIARGDALYALGRSDLAQAAYRAAIAIDPTAVNAEVGFGRTLARSDPRAAEAAFLTALAREPDNVVALNNLGVVRDLQGRNAEAQKAYDYALTVAPGSTDVQINLGTSLTLSGHNAEAVQLLRDVANTPGVAQAWGQRLIAALTLAGDGPWAQQLLQADQFQAPQDPIFAAENIHLASTEESSPIVSKVTGYGLVKGPGPAPLANGERPGSGSETSHATHSSTDALVAELPESIQIPVPAAAPRTPVIATNLPSFVTAPDVVPPVALRPIATVSSKSAEASPFQPDSMTGPIDTTVATLLPSVLDLAVQITDPRPTPTAPTAAETPDVTTVESAPYVQLASLTSEPDAEFEWRRLNTRLSPLLGGREPTITRAEVRGQTYWRLRTWGFASLAEAHELCGQLKVAGLRCWSGRGL
jgi:Flp pilus assembly protein TadD